MAWAAAVLCGGASRRSGRDKALLVVDGRPMVRRVVAAARASGAAAVVTVGGDEPGLRAALAGLDGVDVPVLPDDHPGEGPLGGLLTALRVGTEAIVLVLSCDLLAPDAGTMAATVAALDPAVLDRGPVDAAIDATTRGGRLLGVRPGPHGRAAVPAAGAGAADVAVPEVDGRTQWLHAAWRRAGAREPLAQRFAAGERSIHRAVAQVGLTVVPVPQADPAALADADTPDDLPGSRPGRH